MFLSADITTLSGSHDSSQTWFHSGALPSEQDLGTAANSRIWTQVLTLLDIPSPNLK